MPCRLPCPPRTGALPTARTGTLSTGAAAPHSPAPLAASHTPRRTRRSHCRAARRLPRRSRIAAPLVAPLAAPHAVQRCLVSTCGEDEKAHTMGQRHWRRGEGRWRGEEVAGGAAHLLVLSRPPCLRRMVAAAPCRRRRLECPRGAIGTTDRTRWPCLWAGGAQAHVAALAAGAVAGSPAPFLVCPSAPVASKSSSLLHAQAHEEDWCARHVSGSNIGRLRPGKGRDAKEDRVRA